jgi:hypothetical protein
MTVIYTFEIFKTLVHMILITHVHWFWYIYIYILIISFYTHNDFEKQLSERVRVHSSPSSAKLEPCFQTNIVSETQRLSHTHRTTERYLYISLTVHHDINQFVITNLMHICGACTIETSWWWTLWCPKHVEVMM